MTISVREVLKLPILSSAVLVAGANGTHRFVRWVHVSEIRDVARFLKGGELILSHGLELRHASQAERSQYIKEISQAGASGIVIELGRSFQEIPQSMLETADKMEFPLIVLNKEVSFSDITNAVHTYIVDVRSVIRHDVTQFESDLIGAMARRSNLQDLLKIVAEALSRPVILLRTDKPDFMISFPGTDHEDAGLAKLLRELRASCTGLDSLFIRLRNNGYLLHRQPIRYSDFVWGELILLPNKAIGEFEEILMQRAALILSIEAARVSELAMDLRSLTRDLFDLLFQSQLTLQWEKAQKLSEQLGLFFGTDLYGAMYASVGDRHDPPSMALCEEIERIASNFAIKTMPTLWNSGLGILVAASDSEELQRRIRILSTAMNRWLRKADGPHITSIGAGSIAHNIVELGRSIQEAVQACKIRNTTEGDPFFGTLGWYRILGELDVSTRLRQTATEQLAPLIMYDAANGLHRKNLAVQWHDLT